jgi:NACHT domain- and WD repeat-containing protein
MLAKIAADSTSWFTSKNCTPIRLVRFLGTTPDSSSIGPLLRCVCQQISFLYQVQDNNIPVELSQLIKHFKCLLEKATADKPLCMFFDSLDQLSSADGAHSMSWMPPTLPKHVKFVGENLFPKRANKQISIF